ncbi:hypothetical protein ACN47E_008119 [Coniothyrium glycines]
MPTSCYAPRVGRNNVDASYNVTELILQRIQNSPKDDWDRLFRCWGYSDCGDCHRSEGHCGWCAISSTCLPLPLDPLSRAFPLLSPIRHKEICALGLERFELRTAGLGCQVSTITFLTSIVTIICTVFGVFVLVGILKLYRAIAAAIRGSKGGYAVYGDGTQGIWVRGNEISGSWRRRMRAKQREFEVEDIVDGVPRRVAERRPLLTDRDDNTQT